MANGVELATAYVSVIPRLTGAPAAISRGLSGLDAEGARAGQRMGGGILSGLKKMAGPIAAAVATIGLGSLVAEAAKASDATDKFKATMNFAGVDTSGIQAATKAAKEYADQTVYDLPTIQNMLAQLASNGVKDYTGLTKAAGNLNAVAGGNADTFKSVAMVMTQTAGAGKLTTENWNQLSDAIPGAAGPLQEALKKAGAFTGNFRDAMAQGQITSDEFNAALMELGTKPVAVEAAKSTATFEGAIGNLMATINGGLMTALDGIKPMATGAITAVSDGLGKAFDWAATAAQGLYDVIVKNDFSSAFATAFHVEEDNPFVGFLFDTTASIHNFIAGLKGEVSAADFERIADGPLKTFALLGASIRDTFGQVAAVIGPTLTVLGQTFGPIAGQVLELVTSLSPLHLIFVALLPVLPQIAVLVGDIAVTFGEVLAKILPVVVDLVGGLAKALGDMAPIIGDLVVGALRTFSDVLNAIPIDVLTTALVVAGGGFLAYKAIMTGVTVATNIFSTAQKLAAGAVKLFNAAMKMNVIGLVISAIAALVAGLVWFFTQTELGKQIIANVWSFIQTAIQAVGDWFTNTLVPAFQAAVKWIGDAFTWVYESIIKPVFDGIAAVFTWWWQNVTMPVFNAVSSAVTALGGFFTWLYNDILSPIFQLVAALFAWWWNKITMPIFNAVVGFVRDTLGAIFSWFYDSIIKPVWDAIGSAISWVWNSVVLPVFQAIQNWIGMVGAVVGWLYQNVIKPVWDAIGTAINWVWQNVIMPVFKAIQDTINTVGSVIGWLYQNVVKPQFDAIGKAIQWVWDNIIKPVFDVLQNAIQKDIPNAFEQGKKFIDDIWKGIQDIVKAPVKFVIQTVLNDGLIGAFNNVAGFLGTQKLGLIGLPPGFANGGYTGDGGKYEPKGVVHGGEFVFTKEQTARAGVGNLYALARSLAGYAGGGFVDPLRGGLAVTQGYNRVHKGIDFAAGVGTPVYAANTGVVTWAGPGVQAPGVWGGNEVHILGNGIETWYAHLSQIGVKLGEMVKAGQQVALSGNTGISSGPHLHFGAFQGGWPNDIDPMAFLSGAQADGKPFNPIAGIIDGLVDQFKKAFPAGGFVIDMVGGFAKNLLNMASDAVMNLIGGRSDKKGTATSALFDGGGWLEQTAGPMLVEHKRTKPDAVLTNEQWSTMYRIAEGQRAIGGNGGEVHYHVTDVDELIRKQDERKRDAMALVY